MSFRNDSLSKNIAFTLAEILITLGIIGVVAALTIPMLITKYQKIQTVSKLKKFYSTLNQAIMLSEEDNGNVGSWSIFSATQDTQHEHGRQGIEYLAPYMAGSTKKYAYYSNIDAYGKVDEVVNMAGVSSGDAPMSRYYLMTADGMYISFGISSWAPVMPFVIIQVDINGRNKPNVFGKDVFYFSLYSNRSIKGYNPTNLSRKEILKTTCCKTCSGRNRECSTVIMNDGWAIANDYPW